MRVRLSSESLISVLFVCVLSMTFELHVVKAFTPIYIRGDGSIEPSTAPIQRNGDVYRLTSGITSEGNGIVIQRNNMILDGAGYSLEGMRQNLSMGVLVSGMRNVTVRNLLVRGFWCGLNLTGTSESFLLANSMADNDYGIAIWYSSDRNTVSGNIVTLSFVGVSIIESCDNLLRSNKMSNNDYNLEVLRVVNRSIQTFTNDVDTSNTVNGKPVYYWIGEHDRTVPVDAGYVALVNCTGITIEHLNLKKNGQGILLVTTTNSTIKGCSMAEIEHGISLILSSDYNTVSENSMIENWFGVYVDNSSNNSISRNVIAGCSNIGLLLSFSSNNTLSENRMNDNLENVGVFGSDASHFEHSIGTSNTVDDKPVYYLISQKDVVMTSAEYPQIGYLALVRCSNVTVDGLNLTNNGQGLLLVGTNNSKVTGNDFRDNYNGIRLNWSFNNTLAGNNINRNRWQGILLSSSASNCLCKNEITNNGVGVVSGSYYLPTIRGSKNTWEERGLLLDLRSNYNIIYNNNFVNNTVLVSTDCFANSWDNEYPPGGNYWSIYSGGDYLSGPYQNETGDDGIGDTPYVIGKSDIDRYPLTKPFQERTHCIAWFSYLPLIPLSGESVLFDASTSVSKGTMPEYTWDFGDSNVTTTTEPITTHTYTNTGTRTVTLNVTDNNQWNSTSTYVVVTYSTDLNRDSRVNILDITIVATAYGSTQEEPKYNEAADLDKNGTINILDVTVVAKDYGKQLTP